MNWLINIAVWCLRPLYAIHDLGKHGAAAEGAMFYVRDIEQMKSQIMAICENLSKEAFNEAIQEMIKNNNKLIEQEQDDLKRWMEDHIKGLINEYKTENQAEIRELKQLLEQINEDMATLGGVKS